MVIKLMVIIVGFGLLAAACGGDDATPTSTTSAPSAAPTSTPTTPPSAATATLAPTPTPTTATIPDLAMASAGIVDFAHQTLSVQVGTKVTWTHFGAVPHTTTSGTPGDPDTGAIWDSGTLSTDETFSRTFDKVGEFPYFCRFHPSSMRATITVVKSLASQSFSPPGATTSASASGGQDIY